MDANPTDFDLSSVVAQADRYLIVNTGQTK